MTISSSNKEYYQGSLINQHYREASKRFDQYLDGSFFNKKHSILN